MRLIDENEYQEKLARIPMELRTYRKAVEVALDMPTVKAIPIEVVEQIRAEIDKLTIYIAKFIDCTEIHICKDNVLEIIDKAIKEQNE